MSSLCLTACVLVSWLCSATLGEPAVPVGAAKEPATDARQSRWKFEGMNLCQKCHKGPPTEDDKRNGSDKIFDLTEYVTWLEKDKHSHAHAVLKNSQSRQMGRLLGIKPETDPSCVSCHAGIDSNKCDEGVDPQALQEKGVSCEACHGPASGWIDLHSKPKWRKLTREEKAAKGLVELRDAVTRAEVCLSCHVGNAAQGKVLTHDMYAAGHPPLSGFEIETFAAAMPPHWKPASEQAKYTPEQYAIDPKTEMHATRMMTIGGLVALREYARLVGDNAKLRWRPGDVAAGKPGPVGSSATELAFYDCQACHHELTVESWRQKRGYPGRPGRPAVRAWPLALGKLAAAACGPQRAPILDALGKFYQAIDKQPFGAPQALAAASQGLIEKSDAAIRYLQAEPFDRAKGLAILKEICATGATELPDFESARQLGWTFLIVYGELTPRPAHNQGIGEVLAKLKDKLSLTIPTLREELSHANPSDGEFVARESVSRSLLAAAKYNPVEFQDDWKRLGERLSH